MRALVIAGSADQFKTWLRSNNLSESNFVLINDEMKLRGYAYPVIYLVGAYWENPISKSKTLKYLEQSGRAKISKWK